MHQVLSACAALVALSGFGGFHPLAVDRLGAQEPIRGAPAASWTDDSLRPGDAVRLFFSRETGLSGEFEVDDRGSLVLPILGRVGVQGFTAGELKADLEQRFDGELRNQSVQVTPLRRVRAIGAVQRPGLYLTDPTMTVNDVIALAGGVTDRGHPTQIRLLRDGEETRLSMEPGTPVHPVRSGDQILVPERSWFSRNSAVLAGALISAVGFVVGQAIF